MIFPHWGGQYDRDIDECPPRRSDNLHQRLSSALFNDLTQMCTTDQSVISVRAVLAVVDNIADHLVGKGGE
jgi:hypothetical protein